MRKCSENSGKRVMKNYKLSTHSDLIECEFMKFIYHFYRFKFLLLNLG